VKLTKDLSEFIGLLNYHRVEYVLVGGHAVAYHGYPRYTGDIDFFVRPSDTNARLMLLVLQKFGFTDSGIEIKDLTTAGKVIQLGLPPNRIDIVTGISGVSFDEAAEGCIEVSFDGLSLPLIGRAELIINKRATGRMKDMVDIEMLTKDTKVSQ